MEDPDGLYKGLIKNLNPIGYSSHYMAPSMGSLYIVMVYNLGQFIFLFLTYPFRKSHHRLFKYRLRIKEGLMWNFVIRLLMETALELSFCCFLNFPYFYKIPEVSGFFEGLDYFMTILIGIMILVFPFFVAIFYNYNYEKMGEE
jgi:hypothetical protein